MNQEQLTTEISNKKRKICRVETHNQHDQHISQGSSVQKMNKRKHCKIKVPAIGMPKTPLLPTFAEYKALTLQENEAKEMPKTHMYKSKICSEQHPDESTPVSECEEGEIRDESSEKIDYQESEGIDISTGNTCDVLCGTIEKAVIPNQATTKEQQNTHRRIEKPEKGDEDMHNLFSVEHLKVNKELRHEPDEQIIERGGEDNDIEIIEIDDLIHKRVNTQGLSETFQQLQEEGQITELIRHQPKLPGYKVVTVHPIAYNDEIFGDNFPIVSIDINPDTHMSTDAESLPHVHASFASDKTTQESDLQVHSQGNTIEQKLKKIVPAETPDELQVHIPPSTAKSTSALVYHSRKCTRDKTSITVHKVLDESKVGAPIPAQQQLGNLYYCDKCPKSFRDKVYFRKHVTRLCPALTTLECLKCKYCDKMYCHEKNYRAHLSVHDGIKRFTCKPCGESFLTDGEVSKHRKLYCTQKKK